MKHVLATLIQNTALLLTMMIMFDLVASRKPVQNQDLMLASFRLETILIFDTRPILLSVSGLFLGAIPTLFAMVIAAHRMRCRHPLPLSISRKVWSTCQ
jgi:hypothetical protein